MRFACHTIVRRRGSGTRRRRPEAGSECYISEISTAAALVSRRIISWRGSGTKGAAAGSVAAMHLVGLVYELGHGVPQDYEKARQWYERAAVEKGGVGSALSLGMIYEQGGPGLARGLVEARRWYQNAAAKGNAMAKTRLDQLQGPQR